MHNFVWMTVLFPIYFLAFLLSGIIFGFPLILSRGQQNCTIVAIIFRVYMTVYSLFYLYGWVDLLRSDKMAEAMKKGWKLGKPGRR